MNAIWDSLSNLASSNDEEDGENEDDDDDTDLAKMSEDDEPTRVMGESSKMVQHHMDYCRQKRMRLDELTQPGRGDAADYFWAKDTKYGMAEMNVPAVVTPETDSAAATLSPTTFEELIDTSDIIPGQSQITQGTSLPGSSQMGLHSDKAQSHKRIASPDLSPIHIMKLVEPTGIYTYISTQNVISVQELDSDKEIVTTPESFEE